MTVRTLIRSFSILVALVAASIASDTEAQAPGAPTISSTTATANAITVNWAAPSATGVTRYDVRYIETTASNKADDSWTVLTGIWSSGALSYTISDLEDGVSFDIQVRAYTTVVGTWSSTSVKATNDHQNTSDQATPITIGSSLPGRMTRTDFGDHFEFTTTSAGEYWIYTLGPLHVSGTFYNSYGQEWPDLSLPAGVSDYLDGPYGYSRRETLGVGTYKVKIRRASTGPPDSYRLFVVPVSNHGGTAASATTISVGSQVAGNLGSGETEMFKFTLAATTDVWMMTFGANTSGQLLDSGQTLLTSGADNGGYPGHSQSMMIRRSLSAGTYYIKVSGGTGEYELFLRKATTASTSVSSPTDIGLGYARTGHITSTRQHEYFRLPLTAESYVALRLVNFGTEAALDLTILNDANTAVSHSRIEHAAWKLDGSLGAISDHAFAKLPAGEYTVKVSRPSSSTITDLRYLLVIKLDTLRTTGLSKCASIATGFSDPWFGCQWHLHNTGQWNERIGSYHYLDARRDINVKELWDSTQPATMGAGITVGVIDDGLDFRHVDLRDNVDTGKNTNYVSALTDISSNPLARHGTAVAGLIAARDNDVGVRGVAPRATIYGANLIRPGATPLADIVSAAGLHRADTAIQNNSWGASGPSAHATTSAWDDAIAGGLEHGFVVNGEAKGTVYVWPAGNDSASGGSSNLGGYTNHHGVMAICGVGYDEVVSTGSEHGVNLWVCAPSDSRFQVHAPGITTTDNSSVFREGLYRTDFGGTSASAAIVSGVAALVRAANTDLTWRDVKLILAGSARRDRRHAEYPPHWLWQDGAEQYNYNPQNTSSKGTYHYSRGYGFGIVDARAAVDLAKRWTNVPAVLRKSAAEVTLASPGLAIPYTFLHDDNRTFAEVDLQIDDTIEFIEYIEVNLTIDHAAFRDLRIDLISPSGTESQLLATTAWNVGKISSSLPAGYRLGSARHLGETAEGTWKLRFADLLSGDSGTVRHVKITVYGHGHTPMSPALSSVTGGDRMLTIDWTGPSDVGGSAITNYDLRFRRVGDEDGDWTERANVARTDSAVYRLSSLNNGVEYEIAMRARNRSGMSRWCAPVLARTTLVAPTAPRITAVRERSRELRVTWTAPTDGTATLTQYDVRHIRSDASGKSDDANWTLEAAAWTSTAAGALMHTIGGLGLSVLENGVRYDLQVRATNAQGTGPWSATRVATPMIPNLQPSFPGSETGARSVNEHSAAGRNVGSPVRAEDDDTTLTYSLSGADAESFDINPSTGQILTKVDLDHETRDTYNVAVQVSDGQNDNDEDDGVTNDDEQSVTITVVDVNERPVVRGTDLAIRGEATGSYLHPYSASDPEGDDITWSLSGADRDDFVLDEFQNLSFRTPPDFERPTDSNRDNVYRVNVRASDSRLTDSYGVRVVITNDDEAPTISGPADIQYRENNTSAVATYRATDPERRATSLTVGGADADAFTFSGGALRFRSAPDYETKTSYQVAIVASDGNNSTTHAVGIQIQNVDERGSLTLSSDQPVEAVALRATHTDPDGVVSRVWAWERSTSRSGRWQPISGATSGSYTPLQSDAGYYLRLTVTYEDGHGAGKTRSATSARAVIAPPLSNSAPAFSSTAAGQRSVSENSRAGTVVGSPVTATDPDDDPLTYSIDNTSSDRFTIGRSNGQLRVGANAALDAELQSSYAVTVSATDPSGQSATISVTINIDNVSEAPTAVDDTVITNEDEAVGITVLANDSDPEGGSLTVTSFTQPGNGVVTRATDSNVLTYTPSANYYGADSFSYTATDAETLSATGVVHIDVRSVNDQPVFAAETVYREAPRSTTPGTRVGAPVTATDADHRSAELRYYLFDADPLLDIDIVTGQIFVQAGDSTLRDTSSGTVQVIDPESRTGQVRIEITVAGRRAAPTPDAGLPPGPIQQPITSPPTTTVSVAVGGGGPSGPTPSDVDFEWAVKRDIEELDASHGSPAGMWGDGATLWLLENADGAGDAVLVYEIESGERVPDREFALAERNRAPRGIWSDGETVWVSDSGQERLFAYNIEGGGRYEDREIVLAERNRDARGIWSDGETMWVLDSHRGSSFAYDLGTGQLLGEYSLGSRSSDPRGVWSDGVSIWFSDHDLKQLLAYRLPEMPGAPAAEDAEPLLLERAGTEDFTHPSRSGNNSPRGIWSDGEYMYVADEHDGRIYTYNMPARIDSRLAELTLSGVDIGEFDPDATQYEGVPGDGVTQTTVEAVGAQRRAAVIIDPPDAASDIDGHQVNLDGLEALTVTVTSADESRTRVYRVNLPELADEGPCLRGAVATGFSLLVYEGGSVEDLVACAEERNVSALYTLNEGAYLSYVLGAPGIVNARFAELFLDGAPSLTPLMVRAGQPATPASPALDVDTAAWTGCLRGELADGFSLVLYEGGRVADLVACAEARNVSALYVLQDGEWASHIIGAPAFVNARFGRLFAEGLPPATPLIVRRGAP